MAQQSTTLHSASSMRVARERAILTRYGGFYWGADFIGFVVATFFTMVFLGIVGAIIGTVGYQLGAPVPRAGTPVTGTIVNLGIAGLIGALIAVFLAYLIGGYTAGRMARFDPARNGAGVVIWTIIVTIVLGAVSAALGNRFGVAAQLHLSVNTQTLTAAGVISLILTLLVMLLGATLGARMGVDYHRAIDRQIGVR